MANKKYIKGSIEALEFEQLPERCKQMFFEVMSKEVIVTDGYSPYIIFDVYGFDMGMCNSPIEKILLFALRVINFNEHNDIYKIEPQVDIKAGDNNYRVDFCFDTESEDIYYSHYSFENSYKLIIECDGHEFHSTKAQIKHDNERMLDLKKEGYDFLRFSGSQIYNEPWKCARDIIEYIKAKCGKVYKKEDD